MSKNESYSEQVKRLFSQVVPPATDAVGRKILFRCDHCSRLWLQDGGTQELELDTERLTALCIELDASLEHLPLATCRICAAQSGGQVSIDQYTDVLGKAQAFGCSYEGREPVGAHLLCTVMNLRYALSLQGKLPQAQVVTDFQKCRQVLAWLASLAVPTLYRRITPEEGRAMAQRNPPGHRQPGTASFIWQGADWQARCPALSGHVIISVAQAVPASETYSLPVSIWCWRVLAARLQHGKIAGEPPVLRS